MEINVIRDAIDELDREIVELLVQRMALSAEVAEYKKKNNMPILDKAREEALLEKIASLSGGMNEYTRGVYLEILNQSKAYQKKLIDKK